jgi:NitT/TauT family transport system substrate-binding protein
MSRMSRFWWRVGLVALAWLLFVSIAHVSLNFERSDRDVVRMGYMPVVTNLACPLLDYATKQGSGLRFEAVKFSSFADMGEALRQGAIQAGFMIAPLSVVLRQQGEDIKVVYIGNRHESTLVVRQDSNIRSFAELRGKTVAVPMRFSGHYLCARQLAERFGLTESIRLVEMNPPDMASALAAGGLDAYFVGEPFAAQTVTKGHSRVLLYVEEVWPSFICNLVVVRGDLIARHPEWVQQLVQGAARSGLWAKSHTDEAARIASSYWNQPLDLVRYALTTPKDRIVYDQFLPKEEELRALAHKMVRYGLIEDSNIAGLIDDSFAKTANIQDVTDFDSILHPSQ